MTQQLLEVLQKTRAQIQNPRRWCQGILERRNANDEIVACCVLGALNIVNPHCYKDGTYKEFSFKFRSLTKQNIVQYNDTHTHKEVLEVLSTLIDNEVKANANIT